MLGPWDVRRLRVRALVLRGLMWRWERRRRLLLLAWVDSRSRVLRVLLVVRRRVLLRMVGMMRMVSLVLRMIRLCGRLDLIVASYL